MRKMKTEDCSDEKQELSDADLRALEELKMIQELGPERTEEMLQMLERISSDLKE